MKPIFSSSLLWSDFRALMLAARDYVPSRGGGGVFPLMVAAVKFTTQLAIDAAGRDQDEVRSLEHALIVELATWCDEEGALKMRLWTHDVTCVLGELVRTAQRYAAPAQCSGASLKHVVETLPRNLAFAAVAFTTQLAIEEIERDSGEMRDLEITLISALEAPWEIGTIPLKVDVEHGSTWGSPAEET